MKLAASLSLLLSCVLVACGHQTPTPPPALPPVTVPQGAPLYELNFQQVGEGQPAATVQRVLSPSLSSQALQDESEPLGIDTRAVSTASFVTTTDGISTRHIQATFKVTNTSAQALSDFVFVPVVVADGDGDPTNNAQLPTVDGTPFRAVEYFDGSDASSQASKLVLSQGKVLDMSTQQARLDPDADPFLSNLETSGLRPASPAGLTATVLKSGWHIASTLASGASTDVTFAVDLPGVDPTNSKTQPYAFKLVFTGAQDLNGSSLGSTFDPSRVRGFLPNWTFGSTRLFHNIYSSYGYGYPVGNVTSQGEVDVALPSPLGAGLHPLLDAQACATTGTFTAPGTQVALGYLNVKSLQDDPLGDITDVLLDGNTVPGEQIVRLYSDSSGTFQGLVACRNSPPLQMDLTLKQGWNVVQTVEQQDGLLLRNLPATTRTKLAFTRRTPQVAVVFREPSYGYGLVLSPGRPVELGVDFKQEGGISGDITIETDVPGVTVTPSTLTLPKLESGTGGQSLTAQQVLPSSGGAQLFKLVTPFSKQRLIPLALSTTLTLNAADTVQDYSGNMTLIFKQNGAEVGRGTLYSTQIQVPFVGAGVQGSSDSVTDLPRGSTKTVNIEVTSQNNFTGTTTVTLEGLPTGVTASTETISLTAGQTATTAVQVNISDDAVLGSFQGKVGGPKIRPSYSWNTTGQFWNISIVPARSALNLGSVLQAVPTPRGIWIYGSSKGDSVPTLVRWEGGQEIQREMLTGVAYNDATYASLVPSNGTDDTATVVSTSVVYTSSFYDFVYHLIQIEADGTRSARIFPSVQVGSLFPKGVLDHLGRYWFIHSQVVDGSWQYRFAYIDSAGNVRLHPEILSGYSLEQLTLSPDGRILAAGTSAGIYRIDATTEQLSITAKAGDYNSRLEALDNEGNVYFANFGVVMQARPDGSQRPVSASGSIIGIDRAAPTILWLHDGYGKLMKLNLTTFVTEQTRINSQTNGSFGMRGFVNGDGGVWAILFQYYPQDHAQVPSASLIR